MGRSPLSEKPTLNLTTTIAKSFLAGFTEPLAETSTEIEAKFEDVGLRQARAKLISWVSGVHSFVKNRCFGSGVRSSRQTLDYSQDDSGVKNVGEERGI